MATPPKTILLVDDEGSFRELVKTALEAWGYGVRIAEDGEEALSLTKVGGSPHVVLSDIILSKLDGLSLLKRLKEWNPDIAVILFTANPTIEGAVSAMKEGAEDVLTKPINFKRLRHDLERLFGGSNHPSGGASSRSIPAKSRLHFRKFRPSKEAPISPAR